MMNEYEFFASYEYAPDLKSGTIMKVAHSKFSHVGIIENGKTVFHATGEGFNEVPLQKFCLEHGFEHRFPLYVTDPAGAAGWLRGNIGKDYSESQLIGYALKWFPFLKRWLGDGKRELICTEATLRFGIEYCEIKCSIDPDFAGLDEAVEIMKQAERKI